MTSKLKVDRGVTVVRTGKPLSTATVNRMIARVRRERDRDNLDGHDGDKSDSAMIQPSPDARMSN